MVVGRNSSISGQSIVPHTLYEEERRVGIAAKARHSRSWLTRRYGFDRRDSMVKLSPHPRTEIRVRAMPIEFILVRQDLETDIREI